MNRMGKLLGNSTEGERAVRKFTQRLGILAAAVAFVGVGTSAHAQTDLLYDWKKIDNTTPVPTVTGYIPAPFVSTGNVSAAALATSTFLTSPVLTTREMLPWTRTATRPTAIASKTRPEIRCSPAVTSPRWSLTTAPVAWTASIFSTAACST